MWHHLFDPAWRASRGLGLGALVPALLGMAGLTGCGGSSDNSSVSVATVTVAPANPSVSVGGTVQLTATPKDAGGNTLSGLTASWASSDAAIASVAASSGLLTGVAPGTASVVATIQGVDGTTTVTVVPAVASVAVEPSSATLSVGSTAQLTATPQDAGGNPLTGRTVTWSSSAPDKASVDANSGLVTGVAVGNATITATSEGVVGTAQVTVTTTPVASVSVDPPSANIHAGTTLQLTATAKDAGGTPLPGRVASWSSNNTVVASVNPNTGLVTGNAFGTATITATVEGKTGTSSISVGEPAFLAIETGADVACGIITQSPGETVCWGTSVEGALGNGNSTQLQPEAVNPSLTFSSVFVGLGSAHVCAVTVSRVGYCWGSNNNGEVGNNSSGFPQGTPQTISGNLSFVSVTAGNGSSCGVVTSGIGYCWGAMSDGLGDQSATTSSDTPVQVSGVNTFATISAANNFACGLTLDGKIFCWGANDRGQLARGTLDPGATPAEVLGGRTYTVVSAKHQHACAVATNGAAYCWGPNDNGQGGTGGQLGNSTEPTLVAGNHTFATISAGFLHACGVTTSGQAFCWGSNTNGELGNGSNDAIFTSPVAVSGGLTFVSVSAGFSTTCGLATSGDGYCWGTGTLGDGSSTSSRVPVRVKLQP